jgi:hypothetical protein
VFVVVVVAVVVAGVVVVVVVFGVAVVAVVLLFVVLVLVVDVFGYLHEYVLCLLKELKIRIHSPSSNVKNLFLE